MGTIRFAIKKDAKDKDGLSPIQLVYQLHSEKRRKNIGVKISSENWDIKNQIAIYIKKGKTSNDDIKKVNDKLIDVRRDVERIETRFENNFEDTGKKYSIDDVMNSFDKKSEGPTKENSSSKELYSFVDKYISNHEHTRVHGSLSVYKSLKRHLQDFENRYRKVTFDNIDYAFFQSFENFLHGKTKKTKDGKTVRALNNITVAKQLSTLKTFLNYAKAHGFEVSNKYDSFKIKRETELEVIALTKKEFDLLYNMDLSKKPAWAQVRDVFIMACATGLRYSDIKQLRREHIKRDHIELTAIKTSHKTIIPLNPYSRAILKKYESNALPLPVISNQKSNEHLNNICDWAGINEPVVISRKHGKDRIDTIYKKYELIRFHASRKTFASLSLEQGMRAEYVMKIGGWKDYKSFKRYMNITDDSTRVAMDQAWGAKTVKPKLKAV